MCVCSVCVHMHACVHARVCACGEERRGTELQQTILNACVLFTASKSLLMPTSFRISLYSFDGCLHETEVALTEVYDYVNNGFTSSHGLKTRRVYECTSYVIRLCEQ